MIFTLTTGFAQIAGPWSFNPFLNKPLFLRVCYKSLLKTLWEKEKSLAISPFPTVFSTLFENFQPFSFNLKLFSANSFSLEESKICCLEKGYTVNDGI